MNLKYKIGIMFLATMGMMSCAKNDPFADKMEIGQELPNVYWELGSTVAKAGSDVSFKVMYYPTKGQEIKNIEIWSAITRAQTSSASLKLTSSLAYTQTFSINDTLRRAFLVKEYNHSEEYFDGRQYVFTGSFPTSQTLSPLSWVTPNEWDQKKFDMYYPEDFQKTFVDTVIVSLTKDANYSDLRYVYINYDFKEEQFQSLNAKYNISFPTNTDTGEKSDLWYTDTEKVVGKYYITLDDKRNPIYHEVANPDDAPDGVSLYDVYDSSFWVFCRYSDDEGRVVTTVRPEYMPYLKDLISLIAFEEWIYSSAEMTYAVSFERTYHVIPTIKVYNTVGKAGTDTDDKDVTLN